MNKELPKNLKYLQDIMITGMFQAAISYLGFKSNSEGWIIFTTIVVISMQMLVWVKAKYFYKILKD